jgi:hypothetical protein
MNEATRDRLAAYLNGSLARYELETLQDELNTNAALQAELAQLERVRSIAERSRIMEQARRIHKAKTEAFADVPTRHLVVWGRGVAIAAAACLVVVFYLRLTPVTYLTLSDVERGVPAATGTSPLADLEAGLTLLQQDNATKAASRFRAAQSDSTLTPYYRDAARWYEVMALAETDKPTARQRLAALEADASFQFPVSAFDKWRLRMRLWF